MGAGELSSNTDERIRVLVADDHPVVRTGLAAVIGQEPDLVLVAQAENGERAGALFREYQPNVVLMDLRMPVMDGVEAVREIVAESPDGTTAAVGDDKGNLRVPSDYRTTYQLTRPGTRGGSAAVQARTRHRESGDEGDRGDGQGCGNGRDDAGGAARADFVVESDRAQLSAIVQRVRDGRLRTNIGHVSTLDDAVAALNPTKRRKGKTIIRVRP